MSLWTTLYERYSNPALQRFEPKDTHYGEEFPGRMIIDDKPGIDYGMPRYGLNPFDFIFRTCHVATATWTVNGKAAGTTSVLDCN